MFFKKTKIKFEKKLDEISFYIKNTNQKVYDLSYSIQDVALLKTKVEELEKQNIQLQKNYKDLLESYKKSEALRERACDVLAKLATAEEVAKLATAEEVAKHFTSISNTFDAKHEVYQASLANILQKSENAEKNSNEAVWSHVFHDAVKNTEWLIDHKFFPGRWAIGYPALYAMYRILDNLRPKKILELGLGQSTRMIGQYAACYSDVEHTVVEADKSWIEFFKHDFELPKNTKIANLEYETKPYKNSDVRQYSNFAETFKNQKFDFIFVDAPLGGDMKEFSRVDILNIMPQCLNKDFVILVDDYNRAQEKKTVSEIHKLLEANNISHKNWHYDGQKSTAIICSTTVGFITSI